MYCFIYILETVAARFTKAISRPTVFSLRKTLDIRSTLMKDIKSINTKSEANECKN